ncbi:phosphatase RsbU N-terminal domain-containing protein [Ornithinimicrobium cerasi]|uniref:Phosphoserine phosphatase RsbU, N-terminal domain n=1 Tax=Ornithinimicrobium cerasi TaxID=2248773 RepID=A0A285VT49_9MICO|nr:phosphatase RsbU N-terminal domain-containing protein [Ornithinimicrobium cerasi]SOC57250.1 Phosphoserine phosphatase RsbU, N-terminal domain [Ornithinimicrobium cerasi]
MTDLDAVTKNYRVAFLRYLPARSEAALTLGYEIGRAAVVDGVSVLHLAQVHHAVLAEVLESAPPEEVRAIALAGSDFFMEVLATVDMTQRARRDGPDA